MTLCFCCLLNCSQFIDLFLEIFDGQCLKSLTMIHIRSYCFCGFIWLLLDFVV